MKKLLRTSSPAGPAAARCAAFNRVIQPLGMTEKPIVGIRLDPDELALLEALAAHEERSRSDVVRRAIRAYAEKLGVKAKPTKRLKK